MKILSLSDVVISYIHSPQVSQRFQDVDLIIGCGDLAYNYLEYVLNAVGAPLYFVRGNHDKVVEYHLEGQRTSPWGGVDLHKRIAVYKGLLLAGVEGSLKYRPGQFQYTQSEMWGHVLSLVPGILRNRIVFGRYLDIFVTHAPSAGIHDMEDLPHQGINAFRWLVKVFQPQIHYHGHVHLYGPNHQVESIFGKTRVINTYGFRETELAFDFETNSGVYK